MNTPVKAIKMSHSKYSVNITDENTMTYRIMRCDKDDVTNALDNNFVRDLIYEIHKQREELDRLKLAVNSFTGNTVMMTSPIGDLSVDTTGLRRAVDEISRLQKKIKDIESAVDFVKFTINKPDEK